MLKYGPCCAEVVKLVDTLDSGSSPFTGIGVRVPSSAPAYAFGPLALLASSGRPFEGISRFALLILKTQNSKYRSESSSCFMSTYFNL